MKNGEGNRAMARKLFLEFTEFWYTLSSVAINTIRFPLYDIFRGVL